MTAEIVNHTLVHDVATDDGEVLKPAGTSVPVRRPKGKDIKAVSKMTNDVEIGFALIERLTPLTAQEIAEADNEDLEAIGTIIEGFSKPAQPSGTGSTG